MPQDPDEEHWREFAACRDVDDEQRSWFFGDEDDGSQSMRMHRRAQRDFCFECPVQVPCLSDGIEIDAVNGVWGGLTFSQRKRIVKPLIASLGHSEEVLQVAIERVRANLKL